LPLRQAPEPLNESMHLGYAIQWFAIALIFLVGGAALVRTQRARAAR
jgi:cytochrome oxidase assembly protein ShyY1